MTIAPTPTLDEAAVREALRAVIDPELHDDVVSLGMVKAIEVDGPNVRIELSLTTEGCPLRAQLRDDARLRVGALPGVEHVKVTFGVMDQRQKSALMDRARKTAQEGAPTTSIPATCRIVGIASGKGGVGKSSVTANLAAALALAGKKVGVLDADIWGFSIPRMLGLEGQLQASGTKDSWRMTPLSAPFGDRGGRVDVVSMGFLAQEQEAIMWRGLMLNRALQHFIEDVAWAGDLDHLLIDLPPGTGDIQMGLARMLPRTELVIVTTPALAAQKVATRAADMARKGHLRVAGVVENMSAFVCEHGTSYPLFGAGGGERLATEVGVPLLAQLPLEPAVALGGDEGRPAALGDGPAALAFAALAARLDEVLLEPLPEVALAGCSTRLLDAVAAALGPKPA